MGNNPNHSFIYVQIKIYTKEFTTVYFAVRIFSSLTAC